MKTRGCVFIVAAVFAALLLGLLPVQAQSDFGFGAYQVYKYDGIDIGQYKAPGGPGRETWGFSITAQCLACN